MTIIKMQQFRAVLNNFCLDFAIMWIFNSPIKEVAANYFVVINLAVECCRRNVNSKSLEFFNSKNKWTGKISI